MILFLNNIKISNFYFLFFKIKNKYIYFWIFGLKGFFILRIKNLYFIKKFLFLIFFYKKSSIVKLLIKNLNFLLKVLNFSLSSYIRIWGKGFKFVCKNNNLYIKFGFSHLLFYNLSFLQINYKIWLRWRILFLEFKNLNLLFKFFILLENLKSRDFYTGRGIFLKNRFFFLKKSQKLYI